MSSHESRYVIQAFDERMWSIIDIQTTCVYALGLHELNNLMIYISLVEVSAQSNSSSYLMYLREILCSKIQVSALNVALEVIQTIINSLHAGADIDNPIDLAFLLAADLHGQPVEGSLYRAH